MKTCYVIRNSRTGKCYNQDGRFSRLNPIRTWVFASKGEARDIVEDASLKKHAKRLEIVPVQLLRL